ncbi:hypothetical protein GUJ93_ZPchr0013g35009 [Zizania palustris]|uniref:Uncharacterized protein n=1 Tax=Zizania palustris TaxID=103762 RepID=A0A8J5WWD3_ZIZPA|nr:hypothetical protein GUJ93_ZPchr0013g35009 [Zizania palustris]
MDFFGDEEEYNTNPTPSSNRLNRDLFPEGSREFRTPRSESAVPRGGRGGQGAAVGRGESPPLGAISSVGRASTGGRGANAFSANAADSQEDTDEVFGSQTELGRENGTVITDDDFWKKYTKGHSEWKKLKLGPPENLDQLE